MRVLFSCSVGDGHFLPVLPLASAFAARGDDVAFATAATYRERVENAGFTLLPAGLELDEVEQRFAPARRELESLPFDERRRWAFTWRFAHLTAPTKLPDLLDGIARWRPDLVVHESADLAAPIAAAASGVPSVNHSFGRVVPRDVLALAAHESETLWRERGLEPEPLGGMYRGGYVDICPPSIQGESPPADVGVQLLRACERHHAGPPPPWLAALPGRPLVYVTLGTLYNALAKFRLVLDALADADCNVVATIGRNRDPAELEPLPRNAHVEQYVPQAELLARAAVAVGHGGSGSTLGALAHGVPMLLLPAGADQFENAQACADAGVAFVLRPDALEPAAIRAAVTTLLAEPTYREAAARIAAEIAELPTADDVAAALSDGVRATRPPS